MDYRMRQDYEMQGLRNQDCQSELPRAREVCTSAEIDMVFITVTPAVNREQLG